MKTFFNKDGNMKNYTLGIILDIDYSHGEIFFKSLDGEEHSAVWSGNFIPEDDQVYLFELIDFKNKPHSLDPDYRLFDVQGIHVNDINSILTVLKSIVA